MMTKKFKELLLNNFSAADLQQPEYAVALILSEQNEILLIERAIRESDHWSGHMAFPGGKKEALDPDPLATAIRETHEEVSLSLSKETFLAPMLDISLRKRGLTVPGTIHSYVFVSGKTNLHLDKNEVENAFWIPLEYFRDPQNMGNYAFMRGNMHVNLPCVNYQNKQIWGLTYQLLWHFFSLYQRLDGKDYSHLRPTL